MDPLEDRVRKLEELMNAHKHLGFDGSSKLAGGGDRSVVRAYRTSSTQTIAGTGTPTKVQYNAESFDALSEFDIATNYRFTATTAGKYYVSAMVELNSLGLGDSMFAYIYKNGSVQSSRQQIDFGAGTDVYILIADTVTLVEGDYVEIFVSQNTSNDRFLAADINWVSIHQVS